MLLGSNVEFTKTFGPRSRSYLKVTSFLVVATNTIKSRF